ncbi:transcription antitermination factor NusB [Anaerococcus rubeinfantis]|uniref:transcription antitermination factor NusB n=1 Tax=Anaerococcus rubeinfantis TaxID=1720199 RepID=UPI00073E9E7D|nr:transcription antitermination factor NusB [Anaerococcus rubeinfantis]
MNRKKQRDWAFKLIFEDQIKNIEDIDQALINHEIDLGKDSFLYESLKAYVENFEKLEKIITGQIGSSGLKRLSKVDRAILFLSVNEFENLEIPVSVSINEAVNIAKEYSTSDGYKFINSVLGKIAEKRK